MGNKIIQSKDNAIVGEFNLRDGWTFRVDQYTHSYSHHQIHKISDTNTGRFTKMEMMFLSMNAILIIPLARLIIPYAVQSGIGENNILCITEQRNTCSALERDWYSVHTPPKH